MASPRFRLGHGTTASGPWTWGAYDTAISVASAAYVKVELESTAGVSAIAVSIPTADDTTLAAGVPTVTTDQLTRTAVFQCPTTTTARSLNVQVTINTGLGENGAADASKTSCLQVNIVSPERSLLAMAVSENDEYSRSYGCVKKYNSLVTAVDGLTSASGPVPVATDSHTLAQVLFSNVNLDTGNLADTVTARGNWTQYAAVGSAILVPGPFGKCMRNGAASTKKGFQHAATGWSPTSGITMSCWLRPSNTFVNGSYGRILEKFVATNTWTGGSYDQAGMACTGSQLTGFATADTGAAVCSVAFAGMLVTGGWHHVAFTYDLANAKLYIDGALQTTTAKAGSSLAWRSDGDWFIGTIPMSSYYENFPGGIDDVRIEDTARTEAEIVAAYRAGMGWLP